MQQTNLPGQGPEPTPPTSPSSRESTPVSRQSSDGERVSPVAKPAIAHAAKKPETKPEEKRGLFAAAKDLVFSTVVAPVVKRVVAFQVPTDDAEVIKILADCESKMRQEQGEDFVVLHALISGQLRGPIANYLKANKNLVPEEKIPDILKIIDLVVANGFANLAKQIRESRRTIADYDNQTALVRMLSYMSQQIVTKEWKKEIGGVLEQEKKAKEAVWMQGTALFPDLCTDENKAEAFRKMVQEYIKEGDDKKSAAILQKFIQKHPRGVDKKQSLASLTAALAELKKCEKQKTALFNGVAEAMVALLFPDRDQAFKVVTEGRQLADWLLVSQVRGMIFGSVISTISSLLSSSYDAVAINDSLGEKQRAELKSVMGGADIAPVLGASSVLLTSVAQQMLESGPGLLSLTGSLVAAQQTAAGESEEETKKLQQLARLSEGRFAQSLVNSMQALLQTQDPNLHQLQAFLRTVLKSLVLGVVSKGTSLLIGQGEEIAADDFLNEMTNRLIATSRKFKEEGPVSEEEKAEFDKTIDAFVRDFIKDLPTPPVLVESVVVPLLIDNLKKAIVKLREQGEEERLVAAKDEESRRALQQHESGVGDSLIGFVSSVSQQIVDALPLDAKTLTESYGLASAFEKLSSEYLPGVVIDEQLKQWFQQNIKRVEARKGDLKSFIKTHVEIVLRGAILKTMDLHFTQARSPQLLSKFNAVFASALPAITDATSAGRLRKDMQAIRASKERIKLAEMQAEEVSRSLNVLEENEAVAALQKQYDVLLKAEMGVAHLEEQLNESLSTLNKKKTGGKTNWDLKDLKAIRKATKWRKDQGFATESIDKQKKTLTEEIDRLRLAKTTLGTLTENSQERLDNCEMLLKLLNMPSEDLDLLATAQDTEATLHAATTKAVTLSHDYVEKKGATKGKLRQILEQHEEISFIRAHCQEIIRKEQKNVEQHLGSFKELSSAFMRFLGLDSKDAIALPESLKGLIWPYIEKAQQEQLAPILFDQFSPLLESLYGREENERKLIQLSKGNTLLTGLVKTVCQELVDRFPKWAASYKPLMGEILRLMGTAQPSPEQIEAMERAFQGKLIALGKEKLTEKRLGQLAKELGWLSEADGKALMGLVTGPLWSDPIQRETLINAQLPSGLADREAKIKDLIAHIDHLLVSLGKEALTAEDLVKAYQSLNGERRGDSPVGSPLGRDSSDDEIPREAAPDPRIELLRPVLQKMKLIAITPEELAELAVGNTLPEAKNLQKFVAAQFQFAFENRDAAFTTSVGVLGQFIEGMVLRSLVRIGELYEKEQGRPGGDIFGAMTERLKRLAEEAKVQEGETAEDVARRLIESVLADVLKFRSKEDLRSIPPALQELVFGKMKELAFLYLNPVILPIVEREKLRQDLDRVSGSQLLSGLGGTLAKDVFKHLPGFVDDYRVVAREILVSFDRTYKPNDEMVGRFAEDIARLSQSGAVKNKALVQAYFDRMTNDGIAVRKNKEELKRILARLEAKQKIGKIKSTPAALVQTAAGTVGIRLDERVREVAEREIHKFLHAGDAGRASAAYHNSAEVISAYLEGALLKMLQVIARKNPPLLCFKSENRVTGESVTVNENTFDEATRTRYDEGRVVEVEIQGEGLKSVVKTAQGPIIFDAKHMTLLRKGRVVEENGHRNRLQESVVIAKDSHRIVDSTAMMCERMVDVAKKEYLKAKEGRYKVNIEGRGDVSIWELDDPIPALAEKISEVVMSDVLGIASPDSLNGLPDVLKQPLYDMLKGVVKDKVAEMCESLKATNAAAVAAKEQAHTDRELLFSRLAEDITNKVLRSTTATLADIRDVRGEEGEGKRYGVITTSKGIESYLTSLTGSLETARVLLGFGARDVLETTLEDVLLDVEDKVKDLREPDQILPGTAREEDVVAAVVSGELTKILASTVERTEAFAEEKQAAFAQDLMRPVLGLFTNHLKHLNRAKDIAKRDKHAGPISHADFMAGVEVAYREDEAQLQREKAELAAISVELRQRETELADLDTRLSVAANKKVLGASEKERLALEEIKILREKKAKLESRIQIQEKDSEMVHRKMHEAVPTAPLSYSRSVEWVMNSLGFDAKTSYLKAAAKGKVENLERELADNKKRLTALLSNATDGQKELIEKYVAIQVDRQNEVKERIAGLEGLVRALRVKKQPSAEEIGVYEKKLKEERAAGATNERIAQLEGIIKGLRESRPVNAKRLKTLEVGLKEEKTNGLEECRLAVREIARKLYADLAIEDVVWQKACDLKVEEHQLTRQVKSARKAYNAYLTDVRQKVEGFISEMVQREKAGIQQIDMDELAKKIESIDPYDDISDDLAMPDEQAINRDKAQKLLKEDLLKIKGGTTLKEMMRTEGSAQDAQRGKFYKHASDQLLKLLFPNREKDLTFVPENLRSMVWGILKTNGIPSLLSLMTDTILNPAMINTIVLKSLESTRDTMRGEAVLSPPEPEDLPFNGLDTAMGDLVVEALKSAEVPEWMKKLMIDPKTGETTEAMKRSMGAMLRKQFGDHFIKDTIKISIVNSVARDANLDHAIQYKPMTPAAQKAAEKKTVEDIKRVSREVVDASISYTVRSTWKAWQKSVDDVIAAKFGKVGTGLKKAMDAVCRFVFLTIIGNILLFVFNRSWFKEIIYKVIHLDKARDNLLALFTSIPKDSPVEGSAYAVYHEDLVFKIGDAIEKVVHRYMEQVPVASQPASRVRDRR